MAANTSDIRLEPSEDPTQESSPLTEKTAFEMDEKHVLEKIPKDKLNLVLLVMTLHGIGTLIAWNVFITIAPAYFIDTKLKPATQPDDPFYVKNFMNFVCLFSQLPNLTVNAIGLFVEKGNLFWRVVISLFVVIVSCIFTIVFVFVNTDTWPFGFFCLTMATVVVLNSANGFYQNSIFGLVGSFPAKYINAVVVGNNICGLLVSIFCLLVVLFIPNAQMSTAIYFSIALIALILCVGSFFYLRKNEFYIFQMAVEKRASQERGVYALRDYISTFKQFWRPLLNVWSVFFVTLFLFPSVLLNVKLYPLSRNTKEAYDLFIPQNLFAIVFIFLNFNFFSVVGSKSADFFQFPKSPKYLWIPCVVRFLFIPFFFSCAYIPSDWRGAWPILIKNEWAFFVLVSLMSYSHGYYSSIAMMYAPRGADASKARIVGKMSAFFLVFGIASGIACSFIAEYPVHIGSKTV
uniref:Nucleoside transporter n=1 Tax=Panagrolaimus sp. JU765 TaxID=591449 RepID=A0AC34R1N3_9BILA